MKNTALRAEAQSANNTHMVFTNEEHEKFYYEKIGKYAFCDQTINQSLYRIWTPACGFGKTLGYFIFTDRSILPYNFHNFKFSLGNLW